MLLLEKVERLVLSGGAEGVAIGDAAQQLDGVLSAPAVPDAVEPVDVEQDELRRVLGVAS